MLVVTVKGRQHNSANFLQKGAKRMTNQMAVSQDRAALSVSTSDPWARAAEEWLAKRRSDTTKLTYLAGWKHFLNWFARHPSAATVRDISEYRDSLISNGKSSATISNRLAAIGSFYDYVKTLGLIERNPADGVERPTVEPYSTAKWLTTGEEAQLLAAPDRSTLEGKRDYAILVVMLTMGVRRAEVASMCIGDLYMRGDGTVQLRYKPKGGKVQTRPVPSAAWIAIKDYIQERGEFEDEAPVFAAHDRAARWRQRGTPITPETVRLIVARHSRKALGRVVNPHALRHTC